MLPNLSGTINNEHLANKILAEVKSVGFEYSLVHGKRKAWFERVSPSFFRENAVLVQFRPTATYIVRRKLREVGSTSTQLYCNRMHQDSLFTMILFDFLNWESERKLRNTTAREQRTRNISIN